MRIIEYLKSSVCRYPEKNVLVHKNIRLTYSVLDTVSDTFAVQLMKKGVSKGDRVALFLDNGSEYLVSFFGILKAGAVAVPVSSQLLQRELSICMEDCTPKIIVTDAGHSGIVKEAVKKSAGQAELSVPDTQALMKDSADADASSLSSVTANERDCAVILYTSGTTGKPKGVMLSQMYYLYSDLLRLKYRIVFFWFYF